MIPRSPPGPAAKSTTGCRTPIRISTQVRLDESRSLEIADGATLEWFVEHIADRTVVSVFLINTRQAPPGKRPPDEAWMYQPQLTVTGGDAVFEPRRLPRDRPDSDPDIASADLIYRNRREFAVGHGIAADWHIETPDAERATEIRTSVIPTQEVFGVTGPTGVPSPSMDALAEAASPDQVAAVVEPMLKAYETWIEAREVEAVTPSCRPMGRSRSSMSRHSDGASSACGRGSPQSPNTKTPSGRSSRESCDGDAATCFDPSSTKATWRGTTGRCAVPARVATLPARIHPSGNHGLGLPGP